LNSFYFSQKLFDSLFCVFQVQNIQFNSVQSLSWVQPLQPHEPQHARPPCPSPTPGVYSNSCPLSWWCHPTILLLLLHCLSFLSFPHWMTGFFQCGQVMLLMNSVNCGCGSRRDTLILGNIITSDMQMTPLLLAESEEELKSLLMKVKES